MNELKPCPFCGECAEIERNDNVFYGQRYQHRYPGEVARQDHGFRAVCCACRSGTCWWHYENEATREWNTRPAEDELRMELASVQGTLRAERQAREMEREISKEER